MGYALMSARKILLTNRINTINFQLMCLSEAQTALSNRMNNFQRLMGAQNMYNNIMNMGNMLSSFMGNGCNGLNMLSSFLGNGSGSCSSCGGGSSNLLGMLAGSAISSLLGSGSGSNLLSSMFGGTGGLFGNYTAMGYNSDFMQYFGPYAQCAMIENDVESQKKQLETQLQVATKELESVEKAEEQAIGRATPKYA